MKVPTPKKFGIKKSQLEGVERKLDRTTYLLTHVVPLIVGITGGILLYISVFHKFDPHGIAQHVQQAFVLGSIVVLCIGISMLLFRGANYFYTEYFKRSSDVYKKASGYKNERSVYDFWKLRLDDSYWLYLDGLSVENEILNMYSAMGFSVKSEIPKETIGTDYLLSDESGRTVYMRCNSLESNAGAEFIHDLLNGKTDADEVHIISTRGFNNNLPAQISGKNIKLISAAGLANLANQKSFQK